MYKKKCRREMLNIIKYYIERDGIICVECVGEANKSQLYKLCEIRCRIDDNSSFIYIYVYNKSGDCFFSSFSGWIEMERSVSLYILSPLYINIIYVREMNAYMYYL